VRTPNSTPAIKIYGVLYLISSGIVVSQGTHSLSLVTASVN